MNNKVKYKLDRISHIYDSVKKEVSSRLESINDKKTKVYLNLEKLKKNGFYRFNFSVGGFGDDSEILYEGPGLDLVKDLNAKESFELLDRLSLELKNELGFAWSIGDLADLPKGYRRGFLGLDG